MNKTMPLEISVIYFNDKSKTFMPNCRPIERKQKGSQSVKRNDCRIC